MPPAAFFDLTQIDFDRIVYDKEAIRAINPQRYEMEHLDAIVYEHPVEHMMVGYRDVRHDEFWVRGHMPGFPLMPGVIICEAAAQLCAFICKKRDLLGGDFLAFGGMENVRFRRAVYPGDRLVLISKLTKFSRRLINSSSQGFVGDQMVFEGDILGVPFSKAGQEG